MKREKLYRLSVDDMILEYFMTIDDSVVSEPYGIGISKCHVLNPVEEYAIVDHVGSNQQDVCQLIEKLAKEKVFPVSLAEILDDYLAEF